MQLGRTTAILRIFDEAKGREFYLEDLGFSVVFEHKRARPSSVPCLAITRASAQTKPS